MRTRLAQVRRPVKVAGLLAAGALLVTSCATAGADSAPAPKPVRPARVVLPGALPLVTIRAEGDGSVLVNDVGPCSNLSAASLGRGELELHRPGTVDTALTVRFTTAGLAFANGDVEPLANEITIPVGAATASVWVTPTTGNVSAPAHVHRSSSLTLTVTDTDSYDLGAAPTAAIAVSVDVDLHGCATPATAS